MFKLKESMDGNELTVGRLHGQRLLGVVDWAGRTEKSRIVVYGSILADAQVQHAAMAIRMRSTDAAPQWAAPALFGEALGLSKLFLKKRN